jgi:hypothetical protein
MKRKGLSAGWCNVCVASVLLVTLVACVVVPADGGGNGRTDIAAIAIVGKHVYGLRDLGRIVFLGAEEGAVDAHMLTEARFAVEADVGVKVLPEPAADRPDLSLPPVTPVDSETRKIGVSICLGRFHLGNAGRSTVSPMAILSGRDAWDHQYMLERAGHPIPSECRAITRSRWDARKLVQLIPNTVALQ